jgi:hypothetical protein
MTSQCQYQKYQSLMARAKPHKIRCNPLRRKEFHGIVGAACNEMQSSPAKHMVDDTRDEFG